MIYRKVVDQYRYESIQSAHDAWSSVKGLHVMKVVSYDPLSGVISTEAAAGVPWDPNCVDEHRWFSLGHSVALLHSAPIPPLLAARKLPYKDQLQSRLDDIGDDIVDKAWKQRVMRYICDGCHALADDSDADVLLHCDLHSGNIIYDEETSSITFIDFDEAIVGKRQEGINRLVNAMFIPNSPPRCTLDDIEGPARANMMAFFAGYKYLSADQLSVHIWASRALCGIRWEISQGRTEQAKGLVDAITRTMDRQSFRPIQVADRDKVKSLCQGVFGGNDYVVNYFDEYLKREDVRFIGLFQADEKKEELLTFGITFLIDQGSTAWICGVRVSPLHTGKGLGKLMCRYLIQTGQMMGASRARETVNTSSHAAVHLATRVGFSRIVDHPLGRFQKGSTLDALANLIRLSAPYDDAPLTRLGLDQFSCDRNLCIAYLGAWVYFSGLDKSKVPADVMIWMGPEDSFSFSTVSLNSSQGKALCINVYAPTKRLLLAHLSKLVDLTKFQDYEMHLQPTMKREWLPPSIDYYKCSNVGINQLIY